MGVYYFKATDMNISLSKGAQYKGEFPRSLVLKNIVIVGESSSVIERKEIFLLASCLNIFLSSHQPRGREK